MPALLSRNVGHHIFGVETNMKHSENELGFAQEPFGRTSMMFVDAAKQTRQGDLG